MCILENIPKSLCSFHDTGQPYLSISVRKASLRTITRQSYSCRLRSSLYPQLILIDASKVLVTHHVDLVLPGAHYLVRMLDGRIDTQGTVEQLREQGVLEDIAFDAAVDKNLDEAALTESKGAEANEGDVTPDGSLEATSPTQDKKPRKLVKDEHRETGGVKWSIYNSYLKAS